MEGMEDTCHSPSPTLRSSPNISHSKVPQAIAFPAPLFPLEALPGCLSHLGTGLGEGLGEDVPGEVAGQQARWRVAEG